MRGCEGDATAPLMEQPDTSGAEEAHPGGEACLVDNEGRGSKRRHDGQGPRSSDDGDAEAIDVDDVQCDECGAKGHGNRPCDDACCTGGACCPAAEVLERALAQARAGEAATRGQLSREPDNYVGYSDHRPRAAA